MDELKYGTKNKRGDFAPKEPLQINPLFRMPPKPLNFLKWLPGYFYPWNLMFMALAVVFWLYFTPSIETMK